MKPMELRIHYAGPPETIYHKMNLAKLFVDVVYEDGSYRMLKNDEYEIYPCNEIKNTKKNYYVLQYTENGKILKKQFSVFAILNQEYKDQPLKIIQNVQGKSVDYTAAFKANLMDPFFNAVIFSFQRFAKVAWDGEYYITIPITKGIATRYASDWHVIVSNHCYIANQIKCYIDKKEENESEKEENGTGSSRKEE